MENFNIHQKPDTRTGFYYVSVQRGNGNYRLLRGPFINDHKAALGAVRDAMNTARDMDPKAEWYAYGTSYSPVDLDVGIFDKMK